jgi:hypothetical protein
VTTSNPQKYTHQENGFNACSSSSALVPAAAQTEKKIDQVSQAKQQTVDFTSLCASVRELRQLFVPAKVEQAGLMCKQLYLARKRHAF